jgi:hypothetical protein
MKDGSMKYEKNDCLACTSGAVSYKIDKCPEEPRENLCGPVLPTQYEEKYCSGVQEVCGYYGNGWIKQYKTGCEACKNWQIRSFTLGICT